MLGLLVFQVAVQRQFCSPIQSLSLRWLLADYYHHAHSYIKKAMYTGFFFKIWDNLFGTVSKGPCVCAKCEAEKGLRSRELWDKVEKPDYSVLLQVRCVCGS